MTAKSIERLRLSGVDHLAIGAIALYQKTISKVTPARCRFTPSCSQYGIEAIQEWGVIQGVVLTHDRINRCRRPNGGVDVVPIRSAIASEDVLSEMESVESNKDAGIIEAYDHQFKTVFSYPCDREFISKVDLKDKLRDFKGIVLDEPQYDLRYKVSKIEAGVIDGFYLIRMTGTTSAEYLETKVDEVSELLQIQMASYFLATDKGEFSTLYLEIDGQVAIKPEPNTKSVPTGFQAGDFWTYLGSPEAWDDFWGEFTIQLIDTAFQAAASDPDGCVDGCSEINLDLNPFDGDGCELGGCDTDGCDLDGCDGAEGCFDVLGDGCAEGCAEGLSGCGS